MKTRRTWVVLPLALLAATVAGPVSADQGWVLEERLNAPQTLLGVQTDTVRHRDSWSHSQQPDQLVRASTPVAGHIAMQQVQLEGGGFQMLDVASLTLADGGDLQPGQGPRHVLMLLQDLKRPLKPGDSFDLTLYYEHAEPHTLSVRVLTPSRPLPA